MKVVLPWEITQDPRVKSVELRVKSFFLKKKSSKEPCLEGQRFSAIVMAQCL